MNWEGPYRITSFKGKNVAVIRAVANPSKEKVVSVSKLKKYIEDEVLKNYSKLQEPSSSDSEEEQPEQELKIDRVPVDLDEAVDEDPDQYEVEEIRDVRDLHGSTQYFIKWKGYTDRYNSWVKRT